MRRADQLLVVPFIRMLAGTCADLQARPCSEAFTIDERWEDNGTLVGVMLRAGKSQIGLNQDDWKKGRDRKKGIGMRSLISTPQNVDEIAGRARAAGIQLKSEPHDTEWKSRTFEVADPSGFVLTIYSEHHA